MRKAADKRFKALEEVIHALQKQCEDAEANAEVWKAEALRPGNKRGGISIGTTPVTQTRIRPRMTPAETLGATRRVDERLKGLVERHQEEVGILQDQRVKEMNARKQSEEELEKLKQEMTRLDVENRRKTRSNLKARMDEAAVTTVRREKNRECEGVVFSAVKSVGKVGASPAPLNNREAFLRAARKELRGKKKDQIIEICGKEGVDYTTLNPTKEFIARRRTERAFDEKMDEARSKEKEVLEVTEDGEESEDDGRESADS
ncbi:hypothetical protein CBR_g32283 [Chara braunii]|uniref:Uncharacterized protein n=1 Tax=Chara braunii TaxID=69332 RepID=A0A388JNB2_CHABU|nr:hypothetical protein CBR_g32283 [Chara braunii]|eukprot:GBG59268.1 hypothetical protein CBR_g32283 [Chara braunii]